MSISDMEVLGFGSREGDAVHVIANSALSAAVHTALKEVGAHPMSCIAVLLGQVLSLMECASKEGCAILVEDMTADKQDADRQMRAMKLLIAGYEAQTAKGRA